MRESFDISGTSPASASTIAGAMCSGLAHWNGLRVEAQLVGATGGTLNVYLQRKVAANLWVDWVHFPQLTAGAGAVAYSFCVQSSTPSSGTLTAITTRGTDAAPSPGMAEGLDLVHPGDMVRVVYVAGASTSAGAVCKIYVSSIGPA